MAVDGAVLGAGDRIPRGTGVWLLFLFIIAMIWMTVISSAWQDWCPVGLVTNSEGNIKITSQAKASQEEHKDGQCFARGKAEYQGQSSEQLHNFSNSG